MLLTGSSPSLVQKIKDALHTAFTIKDLGHANLYLGVELVKIPSGLILSQAHYIADILEDMNMVSAKPTSTPLPTGLRLVAQHDHNPINVSAYRKLVGRLLYLNLSRPDIAFATQQLSQFLDNPSTSHWKAAQHLLRYLHGTINLCLTFSSSPNTQLVAYSDSDWGTCSDSRKSITGFCIFLGSNLISWRAKKQSTVSLSSAEAEYRSMASTTCELVWITYILQALHQPVALPIPLYCDNQAAIHISHNPVFHERTKHLDIACHFVREQFLKGLVLPSHISSKDQPADLFTKALSGPVFRFLRAKLHFTGLGLREECEELVDNQRKKKEQKKGGTTGQQQTAYAIQHMSYQ